MKIIYKTRATAVGGRSGRSALDDGSLAFDLARPGSGKPGANPEQLFSIGYAACFDSALNLMAPRSGKRIEGSKTSVEVGLGEKPEGGYVLDIDIYVEIKGLSEQSARELVELTHTVCPYSNATRGNVDVRLHATAIPPAQPV